MNNSLINMSDYQKIIFVKDIDESTLSFKEIENLSKTYPFAVFLTSNKSEIHSSNIWNDGVRLTRFIGIDQAHNKINVGDHSLRLTFDYNTGLIGIYDDNSLQSLTIQNISWRSIKEQNITYDKFSSTAIPEIDSIDNKFSITYKFTIENADNANIENVSNTLKIYKNGNTIINNDYSLSNVSVSHKESQLSISYKYEYQINRDTVKDNSVVSYTATSEYSSDVKCTHQMQMYLNPVSYIIVANTEGTNESFQLGSNINVEKGTILNLTFNFQPNDVTSYDSRKIYVSIESKEPAYISLNASTPLDKINTIDVSNGTTTAKLYISDNIAVNTSKQVELIFKVYYKKKDTEPEVFEYLGRTVRMTINGDSTENFIYYGYDDPTEVSFDKSKLIMFGDRWEEYDVLYDHELDTGGPYDHTKPKYIAIPQRYAKDIKPRTDLYIKDKISSKNVYVDNSDAFTIIARNKEIAGTGIEFIVYKSKPELHDMSNNNVFYFGKIQ